MEYIPVVSLSCSKYLDIDAGTTLKDYADVLGNRWNTNTNNKTGQTCTACVQRSEYTYRTYHRWRLMTLYHVHITKHSMQVSQLAKGPIPPIFNLLQEKGKYSWMICLITFNMGIGMATYSQKMRWKDTSSERKYADAYQIGSLQRATIRSLFTNDQYCSTCLRWGGTNLQALIDIMKKY